jgi:ubiquinone biosynthesis protein COQ9
MTETIETIRDRILEAALPGIGQAGWSWDEVVKASPKAGYQDAMAAAVFPSGLNDVVAHFSDRADRLMLKELSAVDPDSMRVRDRVRTAILARFKVLAPDKQIVRTSLAYWAMPTRVLMGQRVLWRTADRIWDWAGDTAKDYNRQTKRGLLCSILLGSSLVWIDDESEGNTVTEQFVDRRIENVMEIGKAIGTMGIVAPNLKRQKR